MQHLDKHPWLFWQSGKEKAARLAVAVRSRWPLLSRLPSCLVALRSALSPTKVTSLSSQLPPLIDSFPNTSVDYLTLHDGLKMRYAVCNPNGPTHSTILIAPGRREFIEKKHYEIGHELLARGFRLIFFEWRGQGLSSRMLQGFARQRDHITDFAAHIDDINLLYDKVVVSNSVGKVFVHGHSMGGHLLLRWLTERPDLKIAGAFLTAPMLALAGPMAHASANFISWSSSKLGYGADYATMQHDYNDDDRMFAGNPLCQDPDRFAIIDRYFTAYPDLAVGGVTWDWIQAAIKSMYTHRRSALERLNTPILTMVGNEDRVTPPDEIIRYLKILPRAETIIIPGSRHDVLNETEACREEAFQQIEAFLKRILASC